ncbi:MULTISPECIES: apolipoprotein N-acyltransferase [unclassified Cyanobium]|uniref:apolipoprotein N-acyltransferase n=1 Tax=unclassified Cyanobium TaxID=2627006 RepID=UPI0020CED766|nr:MULTISPECIES: apolipoprotein N-acyltransferase [unclassified Cyanobium]MCP9833731.1 apolipoprotein N-acyltransferase [Cyanobium sp. La Preciosa 7G6]MCP9936511.1 apolipoprotein N-acyltransferase [Cyanobium sp. Aljojuca 7A6]
MGNDRRAGWVIVGAAGLLAGVALPPVGWPWLLWPALIVLWSLTASRGGTAPFRFWRGGLWGLAAVLVSHRWLLWLHPLDWIGVPGPLSLPICLTLWLAIGLAAGLLVGSWTVLVGRLEPARPSTALLAATLWGLAEVLLARGPLFWLGLGAAALPGDRALAGLAALGGAGLLAAVQLLIGWGLWRALLAVPPRRSRWLLITLLLVAACHLAGVALLDQASVPPGGRAERWLVLQPAIPTREKFEADQQRRLLQRLAQAQRRAASAEPPLQGVLLPEGSLALGQLLPQAAPVEVLSGGFRREGVELRSSLLRFEPGQRQADRWIDKHRLVPLGEWVPLADLWRWSGLSAVGGVEPGPVSRLLARPGGDVAVAICYELSDGTALAAATRQGARWLLASANLDPYPLQLQGQFAALAQLRAIETGRWLVSSANTGPSLLVDAAGRVLEQLPAGRPATGVLTVQQRTQLTPYDRWGEGPLLLIALLAAAWRWIAAVVPDGAGAVSREGR